MRRLTTRMPFSARRLRRGFPGFRHLRKKQRARGAFLIQHPVATVTVDSRWRRRTQARGAIPQMRQALAKELRTLDTAFEDAGLFLRRPPADDAFPGQVHDGIEIFEFVRHRLSPRFGSHKICAASISLVRTGEADYLVAIGRQ